MKNLHFEFRTIFLIVMAGQALSVIYAIWAGMNYERKE